jgi:hypothetical protein
MGIAAEKVDQCIGVVLHGLRVASLDREGSYSHLNASMGDPHSQPRDGRLYGLPAQRRVVQLHWDGTTPRAAPGRAGDEFLKQNGRQRWVLGVRWVLDGRGGDDLHTEREVCRGVC